MAYDTILPRVAYADEPYFTVLTDPKFLRANLTDEARREFFAGGETLVDFMWRTIQLRLSPDFAPTAILEYGCGAARLALPLARRAARRAGTVTAVDRSAEMLRTAREEAAAQHSIPAPTTIRFPMMNPRSRSAPKSPLTMRAGAKTSNRRKAVSSIECAACTAIRPRRAAEKGLRALSTRHADYAGRRLRP